MDAENEGLLEDRELIGMFAAECAENLSVIEGFIGSMQDETEINRAFRAFHTIKGAAVGMGLEAVVSRARKAEAVLSECRKEKRKPAKKEADLISSCWMSLNGIISEITAEPGCTGKFTEEKSGGESDEMKLDFSDAANELKISAHSLDAVINIASENAVKADLAIHMAAEADLNDPINKKKIIAMINDLSRVSDALYRSLYGLRSVNLIPVANRLAAFIPSLCAMTGKKARLAFEGSATQVDKSVIEKLGAPLMHMLRNSVDHGIETPEVRKAAGKDDTGLIKIRAMTEAGMVVISIKDDGAGIDLNKIAVKAAERGLIKAGTVIDTDAACRLILMPGFSTAEAVNDISGRGVGLDVVKKFAESLHGTFEINSGQGKGTEVILKLPASMSVIDAVIFRVFGREFALQERDIKCVMASKNSLTHKAGRAFVRSKGADIPVIDFGNNITGNSESFDGPGFVTLLNCPGLEAGIFTASTPETKSIVISSLGIINENNTVFSGSYIGDNGSPCLMISPERFITRALNNGKRCKNAG